jgi:hypothetical protein
MNKEWHFNRDWEKMKKRVDDLERKIYWLERFKDEEQRKAYIKILMEQ